MSVVSASSLTSATNFITSVGKMFNTSNDQKVPTSYQLAKKGELKAKVNTKRLELDKVEQKFGETHTTDELKEVQKKHAKEIESFEQKLQNCKVVLDESIFNKDEDPELFGLIHAFEVRKTVESRNEYLKNYFKRINYARKPVIELVIKEFVNEISNIKPKFAVKIFNSIYGQYKTANGNSMSVTRYVSHMEGVLKNFYKGSTIERVIELLVKNEVSDPALVQTILANYKSEDDKWIKEHPQKAVIETAMSMLKSHRSFYEILQKFDKSVMTQENQDKFLAKIRELDSLIENARCVSPTYQQFLEKYTYVLKNLRKLDSKPMIKETSNGKQQKVVRFDDDFTKSIKSRVPFKLSKAVKAKIEYCVANDVIPEVVEKEYLPLSGKQRVKKEKVREQHQFIVEDFDTDVLNIENFDKYIVCEKTIPKHERLAYGVRLIKYIIDQTRLVQIANVGRTNMTIYIEY